MPILTIDNEVNIANVNGVTLTVTPITAVNLSTITVSGPKGERGEAGISPSGISVETLNATGLLLSENIESTGRSLYNDIIGLSGLINSNTGFVTQSQLESTGQQAWAANQNNSINLSGDIEQTGAQSIFFASFYADSIGNNLSGNLTQTGNSLWERDSFVSGGLEARISAASSSSIASANFYANGIGINLSGNLAATGTAAILESQNYTNSVGTNLSGSLSLISNNLTLTEQSLLSIIASTGQNSWNAANNNAIALSGNIAGTGAALYGRDASISGGLEARITVSSASTLTSAQTYANGIGNNLSGNLNASGRRAWDDAINLSGRLFATGALIANVSGGLEARISAASASDISTANSYANGIGVNLSGRYAAISGALSITGSALWERDLSISGGLEARMASAGTAITVTGSSTMSSANITGYGSTVVFRSGNNILISGSSSAGGGEINTASNLGIGIGVYNQKVLAELQFNSILGGTGLRVSQSGQNIVVNNPIKSSITMGMREGSTVTTGEKGRVIVGNNGFIVGWDLISKETSNLTLEVWKANKQNPIGSNNICPSLKPSLQSTQYSGSLNLAGWTTSVSDGDIMSLAVINNSASTDFTLRLDVIYI